MNTSAMEIRHLKARIEDKIHHSYLNKYIRKPVIDEEKLIILTAIINHSHLSALQREQYIITTMLVQVALDTHEAVPASSKPDENKDLILTKQLSVLAGDYYSGLYYLLLSEIDDFDLIQTLASAIKEINEYKMNLYYNETQSLYHYIHVVKKVESLLILHVSNYVRDTGMAQIIEEWLIINKLIHEKKDMQSNGGISPLLTKWLNENTNTTYESMLITIDEIIKTNAIHVDKMLNSLPTQQAAFVAHADEKLKVLLYNSTSIVEEG